MTATDAVSHEMGAVYYIQYKTQTQLFLKTEITRNTKCPAKYVKTDVLNSLNLYHRKHTYFMLHRKRQKTWRSGANLINTFKMGFSDFKLKFFLFFGLTPWHAGS